MSTHYSISKRVSFIKPRSVCLFASLEPSNNDARDRGIHSHAVVNEHLNDILFVTFELALDDSHVTAFALSRRLLLHHGTFLVDSK